MRMRLLTLTCCVGLLAATAAATTFVVDGTGDEPDANTADPPCATAGGVCTLRAAIEQANASGTGPHTIEFALPDEGDGVPTITLGSDLPTATRALVVDGYTQPGSQPNTKATGALDTVLTVEVHGGGNRCFRTFHADFVLRGLAISGCTTAINVLATAGGGSTPGAVVTGSFIGTDPTGTVAPGNSSDGVSVSGGALARVGGPTPADRNLISANGGAGVRLSSLDGTVQGNLIGTDRFGTAPFGNGAGVITVAPGAFVIGGATPELGNLVAASVGGGVALGIGSENNVVRHNRIGTDVTGMLDLGNGASAIVVSSGPSLIQDNVIAFNARIGVELGFNNQPNNVGIRITQNSIFSSAGLGIDIIPLGAHEPDPDDADAGTNGQQNFPVLAPGIFAGGTSIDGTLDSTPDTTFRVEVYANEACDPSGNGEGKTFVGANDAVTTDANGDAAFTVMFGQALPAGTILTATATAPDGSTSEFSACTQRPPTTTTTSTTTTTTSSSSTTSTSSSSPVASTSTTSTTTSTSSSAPVTTSPPTSSTTSTTLADACAGEPVGATFRSLNCRLAALLADVQAAAAAGQLGPFATKLPTQVAKAKERKEQAEAECARPNLRKSKGRLKKGIRKLIQIVRTLRSRQAERSMDPAVREAARAAADGIGRDLRLLHQALACPGDAG